MRNKSYRVSKKYYSIRFWTFDLLTQLLTYIHTYLLTSWSRIILEKLTGSQLSKKFSAFYGTQRFVNVFTTAGYLSLAVPDESNPCPPPLPSTSMDFLTHLINICIKPLVIVIYLLIYASVLLHIHLPIILFASFFSFIPLTYTFLVCLAKISMSKTIGQCPEFGSASDPVQLKLYINVRSFYVR